MIAAFLCGLMQHRPAGTAVLAHVDLELLLGPPQSPLLVAFQQGAAIEFRDLEAYIQVPNRQSAAVRDVADSLVFRAARVSKRFFAASDHILRRKTASRVKASYNTIKTRRSFYVQPHCRTL